MLHLRQTKGYALLLCVIFSLALAITLIPTFQQQRLQAHSRNTQAMTSASNLQTIRVGLIESALSRGFNSLSQIGNLPCPATEPESTPLTNCLKHRLGYLPTLSAIKNNYTRSTVPMLWNTAHLERNKSWFYAVSAQVVQPNPLGWSQWVDWQQPPLTLHTPEGTLHDVVAVVASKLTLNPDKSINVSAPYTSIQLADFKNRIRQHTSFQAQSTLNKWLFNWHNNESKPPPLHLANVSPEGSNQWVPADSGCHCHCTKTRCQCGCKVAASWLSAAPEMPSCQSPVNETCTLHGSAKLASYWPVTHMSPKISASGGCKPATNFTCPLSQGHTACECDFRWPASVIQALNENLVIHLQQP